MSLRVKLRQSQLVSLKVYDVLATKLQTLVNEEKPAGSYELNLAVIPACPESGN